MSLRSIVISGRRLGWEWYEGGGGALVFSVGIAFAEEGGGFGGRDAGDFEKQISDDCGGVNGGPAPWRSEGEDKEADPDDGFEKVVWVTRVFPQADLADGFRIGVRCFEGGHLSIGDSFTDESDTCDQRAKNGEKIVGRVGIGGDEVERQSEEKDGECLAEEEQEKHGVHFPVPDLAEFLVTGIF